MGSREAARVLIQQTAEQGVAAVGAENAPRLNANGRLIHTWLPEEPFLEAQFTKLQGQHLAFILAYTKLNRRPPAEADFQRYFDVTSPSVHNMIVALDRRGLIRRTPGRSRSIEVLVPLSEVPPLD